MSCICVNKYKLNCIIKNVNALAFILVILLFFDRVVLFALRIFSTELEDWKQV